ncbi:MAG: alpha/beta hydrolase [Chitinophagales bacterium]|nr:alpha/beta hydrolase [Chitinophagales bacterium]
MKILLNLLVIVQLLPQTMAQNKNDLPSSKPLVIGTTEEIFSRELSENRIVNIYLPEGYNEKDSIRYPVIYALDGGIDEDFLHITGIVQYNTLPWINRIPASIVVGIVNVDRKRDFTGPTNFVNDKKHAPTGGGSAKFIAFIEKDLLPYINATYKTNASRTIIGQSLAGLLATEILFTKPTLFDKYIIVSPSLWWNDGSLLKLQPEILNATYSHPTAVYIGVGKEGLTPGLDSHVMEVDANLLADKISQSKSKNVTVYFDYLPSEDHATVTHPAVFNAFRLLYPDKKEH